MIGEIDDEQLTDYALRRNLDKKELARFLNKNIR
jgi:hypothetical protein